MIVFRIIEKTGLLSLLENSVGGYAIAVCLVLAGAILFSVCLNYGLNYLKKHIGTTGNASEE
jgi:hypothetical protein